MSNKNSKQKIIDSQRAFGAEAQKVFSSAPNQPFFEVALINFLRAGCLSTFWLLKMS